MVVSSPTMTIGARCVSPQQGPQPLQFGQGLGQNRAQAGHFGVGFRLGRDPRHGRGRGLKEGEGHHPSRLWCSGAPLGLRLLSAVARLGAPWKIRCCAFCSPCSGSCWGAL